MVVVECRIYEWAVNLLPYLILLSTFFQEPEAASVNAPVIFTICDLTIDFKVVFVLSLCIWKENVEFKNSCSFFFLIETPVSFF